VYEMLPVTVARSPLAGMSTREEPRWRGCEVRYSASLLPGE
jgi:hypothetical protein